MSFKSLPFIEIYADCNNSKKIMFSLNVEKNKKNIENINLG